MQKVEEIGYVYRRVNKKRRNIRLEHFPVKKDSVAPDGTVLLKPLHVAPVACPAFITVTLVEGVTLQLAAEPTGRPQEPKAPRNDGSAQYSALIIGMSKHACVGDKF